VSFILFARALGMEVVDLTPSDRVRRCATATHPRKKNGAYMWDGSRGWVFDWAGEARTHWYQDPNAQPWTDSEKRMWAIRRQQEVQSRERAYENAALKADVLLRSATTGTHNYLALKGFPDERAFIGQDGALLVPMRSLSGQLQGLQVIRWIEADRRYEKKMLTGMRAKGAVFRLGMPKAAETFLVEGYATGLSVRAALQSVGLRGAVLVCFSAGNLVHVAPQVTGRLFVFADNDASGAGERAAVNTGLPYCMSDAVGEDANDLHKRAGLMAVVAKLMTARRQERAMA